MKTPHDDLEHDLQQLQMRELPAHWKAEILTQAKKRRFNPPRPLAFVLASAWLVIITLHLFTPAAEKSPQAQNAPVFAANSLFALNQHLDLLQP